jgi:16S rRNA (uracil1498-N3)-methyltransferase
VKQFLLGSAPEKDGRLSLTARDYHYLARVRRLRAGDTFQAVLPDGTPARLRITEVLPASLVAEVLPEGNGCGPETPGQGLPALPPLLLFQALPKGAKMDLIVRQATEAGVSEIVPFLSERSEAGRGAAGKMERWRRIIREARQQSGSNIPTKLGGPLSPESFFLYHEELKNRYGNMCSFFLHEQALENASFHRYLGEKTDAIAVAVGPEGGFSAEEARRFAGQGFIPAYLGDTVLRSETAALAAIAAVRIILLEREAWMKYPK